MEVLVLLADYCAWHYTRALDDFFDACVNLLWLIHRSFSIPAKRINERFPSWPLRIIGIVGCFLVIFIGFLMLMCAILLEVALLLLWLLLPIILLLLICLAVRNIILAS